MSLTGFACHPFRKTVTGVAGETLLRLIRIQIEVGSELVEGKTLSLPGVERDAHKPVSLHSLELGNPRGVTSCFRCPLLSP